MTLPWVSQLTIYPIKGCAGIDVSELTFDSDGPLHDRRLMVVDANGLFVTQRQNAKLALIRPLIGADGKIVVAAPGQSPLTLPDPQGEEFSVTVWKDTITAHVYPAEINAWFSTVLGVPVRLVKQAGARERTNKYVDGSFRVSFADGAPVLLTSIGSLNALNSELPSPVPMNRFRANIVIDGTSAYAEDSWTELNIGGVKFGGTWDCSRCVVTTIDQHTLAKGSEPLKTLGAKRKTKDGIIFGKNLVPRSLGTIRLGDALTFP
jgi:uncharacterized protein YcbX